MSSSLQIPADKFLSITWLPSTSAESRNDRAHANLFLTSLFSAALNTIVLLIYLKLAAARNSSKVGVEQILVGLLVLLLLANFSCALDLGDGLHLVDGVTLSSFSYRVVSVLADMVCSILVTAISFQACELKFDGEGKAPWVWAIICHWAGAAFLVAQAFLWILESVLWLQDSQQSYGYLRRVELVLGIVQSTFNVASLRDFGAGNRQRIWAVTALQYLRLAVAFACPFISGTPITMNALRLSQAECAVYTLCGALTIKTEYDASCGALEETLEGKEAEHLLEVVHHRLRVLDMLE